LRRDDSTRPYTHAQPIDASSFAHELVPLALATRLVSAGAYGSDASVSASRLTGIAHTMAALVPLYGRGDGEEDLRRLQEEELLSGRFAKDGGELRFRDGRGPVRDIAATHHGIAEVVRTLASAIDREHGARELLRDRPASHESRLRRRVLADTGVVCIDSGCGLARRLSWNRLPGISLSADALMPTRG